MVTTKIEHSSTQLAAAANIKNIWGTIMYNVKAYGAIADGSSDDTAAIQAAIDACEAAGGGEVFFPLGTYLITSTINVDSVSNVLLSGAGSGAIHDVGASNYATCIRWNGSSGGTMLSLSTVSGASNQALNRLGVKGMMLDGNYLAGIGLKILSVKGGSFTDLYFTEFTQHALYTDVVATLGESRDVQRNRFADLMFRQIISTGDCIYLNGDNFANTSLNLFENLQCQHNNGNGIVLGGTDNNVFIQTGIPRAAGGTGIGLELKGSSVGAGSAATSNYFIQLSPNSVTARAGTYPSANNVILFYDYGNAGVYPTIESGASLQYTLQEFIDVNKAASQLAVGDTPASSKTARENMGSASLRIRNGSSNHTVLEDQFGNSWAFGIDGATGNLRFIRVTGTGSVLLPDVTKYNGQALSVGAADSAGVGFRALRVPN